jgi:hypothetical protein
MTVRGFKPIEITPTMVVESSLFETAPATYAAGTTYALGAYASVAGLLGEIKIYKSLQAGNIGNTPASSPTWWVYSSSTYAVYNPLTTYPLGYRVVDAATHRVKESLRDGNANRPVDNAPAWLYVGKVGYPLTTPFHSLSVTYARDSLVIGWIDSGTDAGVHQVFGVFKSKQDANTNHITDQTIPGVTIPPTPITANTWWELVGLAYPKFSLYAIWAKGEKVIDTDGSIYECQYNDTSRQPLTNAVQWWADVDPSNAAAMFDDEVSTQSIASREMSFTINAGVFDALALVGCEGGVVYVTVRNGLGGAIVYDQNKGISGNVVSDWWAFTYEDATFPLSKVVFDNIPPFVDAHVTIKVVGDSLVKIGKVDIGSFQDIGIGAQYGASVELKDYSIKTTDEFGKSKFVKRGFKELLEVQVMVNKADFLRINNILTNLRSTPWFIQVSDDPDWGQALSHHGFYNSYRSVIDYPTASIYSLQFESLVSL